MHVLQLYMCVRVHVGHICARVIQACESAWVCHGMRICFVSGLRDLHTRVHIGLSDVCTCVPLLTGRVRHSGFFPPRTKN